MVPSGISPLEKGTIEGENPVFGPAVAAVSTM